MPLTSGSGEDTIQRNIRELLRSKTFARGKSKKKRREMAVAAAYSKAREGK
jgi:hypothetical protein